MVPPPVEHERPPVESTDPEGIERWLAESLPNLNLVADLLKEADDIYSRAGRSRSLLAAHLRTRIDGDGWDEQNVWEGWRNPPDSMLPF